ncbi:RlpA-like double-psi beta-barrel domain-containing protein [Streptomyces sp. NPDC001941]|uniref:RlpA-like double-psi beta-barrel domain-containing protein n=1 Tax=Streptomyces sp. NPDC001941 TaxID=3154659 RepID=UPI00331D2729
MLSGSVLTMAPPAQAEPPEQHSNARATYYAVGVGVGACGDANDDADFVVALSPEQFGSYPDVKCGKYVSISFRGKTHLAKVVDEQPGLPDDGLDMSTGLFSYFASLDEGTIYVDWHFVS